MVWENMRLKVNSSKADKGVSVDWIKFAAVFIFVLTTAFCFAAETTKPADSDSTPEQSEEDKPKVMREVAQYWMQIGIAQSKKGLYERAEQSFLTAKGFQEYLTAEEYKRLDELLEGAHKAVIEKQAALEHIKTAKELLIAGEPIKAQAHYEKVRNSPYLTEQERRQISQEIKKVDVNTSRQTSQMTDLYNRSVQLFNAGLLEEARKGFVEVAGYGLFIAPEGQSPEDYLVRIDNILIDRLKYGASAEPSATAELPVAKAQPEQREQSKQQIQKVEQQPAEAEKTAEATPAQAEPSVETRANIIRTYTKAAVEDAEGKAENYIRNNELEKALSDVLTATEIIKENRPYIGDETFSQYTIRLKQLADKIIEAGKTSALPSSQK